MLSCPKCKTRTLSVVDSRVSGQGSYIRRRLRCSSCAESFTSQEITYAKLENKSSDSFINILSLIRKIGRPKLLESDLVLWLIITITGFSVYSAIQVAAMYAMMTTSK